MALGLSTTVRNARAQILIDAINAGTGAGKVKFYDGIRPATGDAQTSLLGTINFADPCASAPVDGVTTFSEMQTGVTATGTGTVTWARITDSDDTFVMDASVTITGGGGDFTFGVVDWEIGAPYAITSAMLIEGGA